MQIYATLFYNPVPLSGRVSVVSMFWLENFSEVYSRPDLMNMYNRPVTSQKIVVENPRLFPQATSGKRSRFLSYKIFFPPISQTQWQEKWIPEAPDMPRDAACGWGNNSWALSGAGLDPQYLISIWLVLLKKLLKKFCELWIISASVVRTELSLVSVHPNFPKADVTCFQNLFLESGCDILQMLKYSPCVQSSYTAVPNHSP